MYKTKGEEWGYRHVFFFFFFFFCFVFDFKATQVDKLKVLWKLWIIQR